MMKKGLLSCLLFCLLLLPAACASAAGARVSDSAGMLSTQEFAIAEKSMNYIVERYNVTVHLFTSEKIGKKDDYRAYVKKQRKKEKENDLLLLFLSTKKDEEVCCIKAYGAAKKNLTEKRLSGIEGAVEKRLRREDYKEAVHFLSGQLLDKMGTRPVFDAFVFHPLLHFLLCVLVTAGLLYRLLRKNVWKKPEGIPYLNEKYSTLLGSLDHFSHISVKAVKTKKKKGKKEEQEEDEFSELPDDFE